MVAVPENPELDSPASQQQRPSVSGWRVFLPRLFILLGVMGVAGGVAWRHNEKRYGSAGAEPVIFSVVVCGVSAGSALAVVAFTANSAQAFNGILGSILLRTLGPLFGGLIWKVARPDWSPDNFFRIHVPMFLVSLTVETILVVDIVSNSSRFITPMGKGRAERKMHG
jgi:hypothetical protein